jgi:hypothetical protein
LAWQRLCDQPLDYVQAVHFVDKKGDLIGGADHPQKNNHLCVRRDTIWVDKLTFAKAQLVGVIYLGLGIYRPGENLLPVSGGVVDWNGGRLLINFASASASPIRLLGIAVTMLILTDKLRAIRIQLKAIECKVT